MLKPLTWNTMMHRKICLGFAFYLGITEVYTAVFRNSPVIKDCDPHEGTNWGMDRVSQRLTAQGREAALPCYSAAVRNTYMTRPLVCNCDGYQVATANIALDDCQGLIFWQLGTGFILQHKRGYAIANLISVWKMSSIFFNTKLKDRLFYLQKKWLEHRKITLKSILG